MDLNTAVQYYLLCKFVYSLMTKIDLRIHLTGRSVTWTASNILMGMTCRFTHFLKYLSLLAGKYFD